MRKDSALAVPESNDATYLGSRFTIRVVENNPMEDRRTLYVQEGAPGEIAHFFGKGRGRREGGAAGLRARCREQLNRAVSTGERCRRANLR